MTNDKRARVEQTRAVHYQMGDTHEVWLCDELLAAWDRETEARALLRELINRHICPVCYAVVDFDTQPHYNDCRARAWLEVNDADTR
jgi:hypothetical protein